MCIKVIMLRHRITCNKAKKNHHHELRKTKERETERRTDRGTLNDDQTRRHVC